MHDDSRQLRMRREQIRPVAAVRRHFAGIRRLIPKPRRLLGGRIVHQFFGRTCGIRVHQLHGLFGWRIFVFIRVNEKPRQLRRLMHKFVLRLVGLAREQYQRFHLRRMPAGGLGRVYHAQRSGAAEPNDAVIDPGLRSQELDRSIQIKRPPFFSHLF